MRRKSHTIARQPDRWPHLPLPAFWSGQFGVNIKSVGVCPFGNEIVFTQGRSSGRPFVSRGVDTFQRGLVHLPVVADPYVSGRMMTTVEGGALPNTASSAVAGLFPLAPRHRRRFC